MPREEKNEYGQERWERLQEVAAGLYVGFGLGLSLRVGWGEHLHREATGFSFIRGGTVGEEFFKKADVLWGRWVIAW